MTRDPKFRSLQELRGPQKPKTNFLINAFCLSNNFKGRTDYGGGPNVARKIPV